MLVTVDRSKLFALLDEIVGRWTAEPKRHPYNKKDAILPQTAIPEGVRSKEKTHACFYFFACIYMRGGIESLQAFRGLSRMWEKYPDLFDPHYAQWYPLGELQKILKEHIGWDSRTAAHNWKENARRLVTHWGGNPLNLLRGLRSYKEAMRRIRNKRTIRDQVAAGRDGGGFLGFQAKMVSMLLYFYDYERWLEVRFSYPTPADFHNFRIGLACGVLTVQTNGTVIRFSEHLSLPWRNAVMAYLKARKADPVVVADALWLFSLTMCGNSPLVSTPSWALESTTLFETSELPHDTMLGVYFAPRYREPLERTCLSCPLLTSCNFAIPSEPYYRRGQLVLRARPRLEDSLPTISL